MTIEQRMIDLTEKLKAYGDAMNDTMTAIHASTDPNLRIPTALSDNLELTAFASSTFAEFVQQRDKRIDDQQQRLN